MGARKRMVVVARPPPEKGMIKVMGLEGYFSAAIAGSTPQIKRVNTPKLTAILPNRVFISSSFVPSFKEYPIPFHPTEVEFL